MPRGSIAGFQADELRALATMAAAAGTIGGVLATHVVPWARARIASRSLQRRIGAKEYSRSDLERALRFYVTPMCSQVDPAGREDHKSLLPMAQRLFKVLDTTLYELPSPRYLILLADSGMGKTAALINYYARNLRRWRGHAPIALFYLGRPGVEERIRSVEKKEDTILFLDALDEDTLAIHDHRSRVATLMHAAQEFRAVVISCRTQFFLTDEEITQDTGLVRIGPRAAGESGLYGFQKLYLSPFSNREIDRFLRKRYPLWRLAQRRRARAIISQIGDLSVRPMLLTYISDLVGSDTPLVQTIDAYERIVNAWIERERAHVTDVQALRTFSDELAIDLYVNREQRGGEHAPHAAIAELADRWRIPLENWKLTGRSLLNRDAVGNYKFAHRSILEYLCVRKSFEGDVRCHQVDWTDQMTRFATELIWGQPQLGSFVSSARAAILRADDNVRRIIEGRLWHLASILLAQASSGRIPSPQPTSADPSAEGPFAPLYLLALCAWVAQCPVSLSVLKLDETLFRDAMRRGTAEPRMVRLSTASADLSWSDTVMLRAEPMDTDPFLRAASAAFGQWLRGRQSEVEVRSAEGAAELRTRSTARTRRDNTELARSSHLFTGRLHLALVVNETSALALVVRLQDTPDSKKGAAGPCSQFVERLLNLFGLFPGPLIVGNFFDPSPLTLRPKQP